MSSSATQRIALRRFPMELLRRNPAKNVLVVGKRGSGKSTLGEDIAYHVRDVIPDGVVISGTEEANQTWGSHFPPSFVWDEYNPDLMMQCILRQRNRFRAAARAGYRREDLRRGGVVSHSAIICEDCFGEREFSTDKGLITACVNGRQWLIFLMILMQECKFVGPRVRTQVDFLFVMGIPSMEERRKIWESWFGVVPTFGMFNQLMNRFTENYGVLVLDNTSLSNDIEKCVYFYRAQPNLRYRFGSAAFWLYDAKFRKSDQERADEEARELEVYSGRVSAARAARQTSSRRR